MNADDNCATSLADIKAGTEILINDQLKINILSDIRLGHKFALKDINKGSTIIKYGEIIGLATQEIKIGDWIHTHNIKSAYLENV